ncbi:MAG TPA: fluoride efflux transporter CrcB [Solirubrobacteraceae bacterium]|nr:fluoride efflux transporter CrcB [Solirubrobacteraceae bacterium]
MSPPLWIAVAALGAVGALARILLEDLVSVKLPLAFPVGTLAVNLSGAFILGVLAGATLTGSAYTLAGGASLGAYTTFSTWMLETHSLAEDTRRQAALANIILSAALGLAAAALGHALGASL